MSYSASRPCVRHSKDVKFHRQRAKYYRVALDGRLAEELLGQLRDKSKMTCSDTNQTLKRQINLAMLFASYTSPNVPTCRSGQDCMLRSTKMASCVRLLLYQILLVWIFPSVKLKWNQVRLLSLPNTNYWILQSVLNLLELRYALILACPNQRKFHLGDLRKITLLQMTFFPHDHHWCVFLSMSRKPPPSSASIRCPREGSNVHYLVCFMTILEHLEWDCSPETLSSSTSLNFLASTFGRGVILPELIPAQHIFRTSRSQ